MLKNYISMFPAYLFASIPFLLFTGPFLPDLASVFLGIFFLYVSFKKKVWKYYFNSKVTRVIILLNCILISSSLFSDYEQYSLETSLFYFRHLLFALAIFYILKNFKNALNYFNNTLYLCLLIGSIDCYIQFISGKNLIGMTSDNVYRLGSFFGDELIIGSYLARLFPFFLAITIDPNRDKKYKLLDKLTFFSIIGAIYLSGERTSFALCVLSIFFLLLINFNKKFFFELITPLLALLIFLNIFFPKIYLKQIEHTKNQFTQENRLTFFSSEHESLYKSAFKMFLDKPLLGQGPRTYRLLCNQDNFSAKKDYAQSCSTHPHNTYFQLLAETGLIFFLIILFIFFLISYLLIKMITNRSKDENDKKETINYFYLVAIFINLFPIIPSGNFFNNWLNILYYLPIGFLFYGFSNKLFTK
jgi:O-antigen ligase